MKHNRDESLTIVDDDDDDDDDDDLHLRRQNNNKKRKGSYSTGTSPSGNHANNAERFLDMCRTLDRILDTYTRTVPRKQSANNYPEIKRDELYLITHLESWLRQHREAEHVFVTRTGKDHEVAKYCNDGRRTIPSTIRNAIALLRDPPAAWGLGTDQKVPLTWVVCYLHDILPDTAMKDWGAFDCSHRCICHDLDANGVDRERRERLVCVDPRCLCWESKSYNQSRGNRFCCKACTHVDCDRTVCVCQNIHDPSCH
jgi:hypothetical protein